MQIFLNGKELDLKPEERVNITLQINDIGDISRPNTSYTNKFKILKTSNNVRVMEFLGVAGNTSRVPYVLNNVTLIEDGLVLLHNGYAEVNDNDELYYTINVYGAEKTFFEKLKAHTLKDIYPTTNVVWTAENLLNYLLTTTNFIFTVAQYNAEAKHSGSLQNTNAVFSKTRATQSTPQFYVKYIFEQIFSYLGYSVSYPMVNDATFAKLLLPAQRGVSSYGVQHGDVFNLKLCVPEKACDVLIREIMFRYGLVIKVDEFHKIVTFIKMDTLLKSGNVIDWTKKFSGTKNEKYSIEGYGQTCRMKYQDDEADDWSPEQFPADELAGKFSVNNQTLTPDVTLIESSFKRPKMYRYSEANDYAVGRIFHYLNHKDYYLLDLAETESSSTGDISFKELPFQIMNRKDIGNVNFSFIEPNGTLRSRYVNAKICTKENISFQKFIDDNYQQLINMLQNMHVVKCYVKLSPVDIATFDFFSRIYLEQYGSYFYVNKISNYRKDKITEVELIKIPPIVGGGNGYYGSTNNMIGTL